MADFRAIEELRDYLVEVRDARRPEVGFDMGAFSNRIAPASDREEVLCGTTACIGGFVCVMNGTFKLDEDIRMEREATQTLGLNAEEADHMFYARWGDNRTAWGASSTDAINYLTKVIEERNVLVKVPITWRV